MKRQFMVIGAGRFGRALTSTLHDLGHEVLIADRSEEQIELVMNHATHAVIADAADEAALRKLGVGNFDVVVVAIGSNFEASVLATVAAKSLGARHVISKASSDLMAQVLSRVGADEVIRPEHDMGRRLAMHLATPSIVDAFNLGEQHGVIEVEAGPRLQGSLRELRLANRFGVQLIAVNRGGQLEISPPSDYRLEPQDKVVLIGSNAAIARFREHLGR
jgi:trk system potassium uptake protein